MYDVITLEDQLIAIVQVSVLPITPGCEQHLIQLIRNGMLRVETENFASDYAKLKEAEDNLHMLLTEMTRQAVALGYNELHESTFFNALSKLCPLFPFC